MTLSDRLARKVILITGAGAGIGRASGLRFDAEGATVIGVGREAAAAEETAQRVRAAGGRAEAEVADVAEPTAVALLFGTVAARHARLDVLFNNAGIVVGGTAQDTSLRSEEHTSELQSHLNLVCRLLLEKKKHVAFARP